MPDVELDRPTALAVCTTLRSIASQIVENCRSKLRKSLGDAGGSKRALDKSGAEVQKEAMQVGLLMHQMAPSSGTSVLAALRSHDSDVEVAGFLRYWAALGLMAGLVAPGIGDDINVSYVDWYRGPPGQARYMPSLASLRSADGLESFILQGWTPPRPPIRKAALTTALGSCFADEIRIWLRQRGYRVNEDFRAGGSYPHVEDSMVPLLQCSAGLVNTFVLVQQFETHHTQDGVEDSFLAKTVAGRWFTSSIVLYVS